MQFRAVAGRRIGKLKMVAPRRFKYLKRKAVFSRE